MSKYKIHIDFEGMKDELDEYDGKIIEASDEDDASQKVKAMLKKDGISLNPYYACWDMEENE